RSAPASLPFFSVWLLRILSDQPRICQPLAGDRRAHLAEPSTIVALSLVEPEGLLVEVPTQVRRINTDVSPFEGTFQETPEIFDIIGMDLSANELDRVV